VNAFIIILEFAKKVQTLAHRPRFPEIFLPRRARNAYSLSTRAQTYNAAAAADARQGTLRFFRETLDRRP
jgi:dienelactone hydrolase